MNEQTTKLIADLASKLGTTTEYLWGVLIKQALYSAITDLGFVIFTAIYGYVLYRIYKWLCQPMTDNKTYTRFDEYEESATMPMFLGFGLFLIFIIANIINFPDIIAGLFNPEYWALHEILKQLK